MFDFAFLRDYFYLIISFSVNVQRHFFLARVHIEKRVSVFLCAIPYEKKDNDNRDNCTTEEKDSDHNHQRFYSHDDEKEGDDNKQENYNKKG